jgi:prepilin peptidase CpaA
MSFSATAALWFLPLVIPLCLYVAFTDLRAMRIANGTVVAIALIFALIGPLVLPFDVYLWQLAQLGIVLVVGIVANATGIMGAGDAKFAAAAAPYIAIGDLQVLVVIFTAILLAAFAAHRIAKFTPLRRMAPDWDSWDQGRKFPMGLALGPSLALYLILAALYGA